MGRHLTNTEVDKALLSTFEGIVKQRQKVKKAGSQKDGKDTRQNQYP